MPEIPDTVGVKCPRCDDLVQCTLKTVLPQVRHKPGPKRGRRDLTEPEPVVLTVPDLADRLADHYTAKHGVVVPSAPMPHVELQAVPSVWPAYASTCVSIEPRQNGKNTRHAGQIAGLDIPGVLPVDEGGPDAQS
jgi:hypothetical protein